MPGQSACSPVRAMLRMQVRPGCGMEFEQAWEKVADAASRWPGNLRQALLRAGADDYIVTSDWVSPEAFRAFERSPDQDMLVAPLRALRVSARMELTEIVLHVDGAAPREPVASTEPLVLEGGLVR